MKTVKRLQEESKEAEAKFWAARNNTVITIGQIGIWIEEVYRETSRINLSDDELIRKLNRKMTEFVLENNQCQEN